MPTPDNQPSPTAEVIAGRNFSRIFQDFQSSGDIFELDTSTLDIYVGPNSDVSQYRVTYYDAQAQDLLNEAIIQPDTPFNGRLDALAQTFIPAINSPAKIVVSSQDFVDPNFIPFTDPPFPPVTPDQVVTFPPRVDLFAVFGLTGDIPTRRADRIERVPAISPVTDDPFVGLYFVFPIYGRSVTTVILSGFADQVATTIELPVRVQDLNAANSDFGEAITTLSISGGGITSQDSVTFTAEVNGFHDLVVCGPLFRIDGGIPSVSTLAQIQIRTSDET